MCEPTMIMMGIGAATSALEVTGANDAAAGQAKSVANQTTRAYTEAAYSQRTQAEEALEEGYIAEIGKRDAMGRAAVKSAGLGIRGTTADELVSAEEQVGNFNVADAKDARRNADSAYLIGTKNTGANANEQISSLKSSMSSPFESALAIGTGGLSGYMTGLDLDAAMTGVPKGVGLT